MEFDQAWSLIRNELIKSVQDRIGDCDFFGIKLVNGRPPACPRNASKTGTKMKQHDPIADLGPLGRLWLGSVVKISVNPPYRWNNDWVVMSDQEICIPDDAEFLFRRDLPAGPISYFARSQNWE